MLSNRPYLEIAKDELNFQEQIGRGAQGYVYKALWKTKQQVVAVKHVFEFDPEINQLQRIQHKHIVQFLGAVEEEHFKAIVLEYAEHGSLYHVIQTEPPDFEQLLIWSRHIALGLNYLHNGVSPRIIHRDLKSRNVVIARIASNRVAKICDFGSSRSLDRTCTKFSKLHGTVAWMAPEVMRAGEVSEKCDTYSFAVLLWELITCKIPFEGEEDPQVMFGVCQKKRRPVIPSSCPEKFEKLISDCWQDDHHKRPSIEDILLVLNSMLGDIQLTEQVDHFLSTRQDWAEEFEKQIEEIKEEFQAIEQQWRDKLEEKDQQIQLLSSNRARVMAPSEDKGISAWKEIEVVQWVSQYLEDIDISNEFFEHNITGSRFINLTDNDLCQMDITSLGHRKDILLAIVELKNRIESIENYPPLLSPNNKADKSVNKSTGTMFALTLTYGNSIYPNPGKPPKWNLFLYVEGDSIATRSIRYVEFRISSTDVVKRERHPYVMDKFRYGQPKGEVECKVVFRNNVIKPKTWNQKFNVVFDKGGYNMSADVQICLNENEAPSTIPSLTSSISSFSSFNVIDNWQTSPVVQGAWSAGPPQSILRSPTVPLAPNWNRRDSSPFTGSPQNSPGVNRRKTGSGNSNLKLNHSSSSPAKMNQQPNSRSRDNRSRDLPLSFQENRSGTGSRGQVSDVTPTHDPKNPRFSSPRGSLGDALQNMDLNKHDINVWNGSDDKLSFGTMDTKELNMNFASARNTLVAEGKDDIFDLEIPTIFADDREESTPKKRGRGISISSTLSGNSGHSILESPSKPGEKRVDVDVPEFRLGVSPSSVDDSATNWWDRPSWGISSNTSNGSQGTASRSDDVISSSSRGEGDVTGRHDNISPNTPTASSTNFKSPSRGYRMPQPPHSASKPLDLASVGKLSYADILKCPTFGDSSGNSSVKPPSDTKSSASGGTLVARSRKNSSGSNNSEREGGSKRRSEGGRRGGGKGGWRGGGRNPNSERDRYRGRF